MGISFDELVSEWVSWAAIEKKYPLPAAALCAMFSIIPPSVNNPASTITLSLNIVNEVRVKVSVASCNKSTILKGDFWGSKSLTSLGSMVF